MSTKGEKTNRKKSKKVSGHSVEEELKGERIGGK